jgi:hypothetical protein
MPIKLNTASGGGVILTGANTASDKTITVPAVDGTMNMSGAANEVPAGSASAPAIYPTGDTNTGIFFPAADTMAFAEGGVESARINSFGQFFIGNTTGVSSGGRAQVVQTDQGNAALSVDATNASFDYNVLFLNTTRAASSAFDYIQCDSGGYAAGQFRVRGDGVIFAQNTTVQSISDARTKENVRDANEGLDTILGLRPVRFDFKEGFGNNRKNQLGFIAQEVETIFPDAVDVVKELDENGESYKSVGPSAMIPVLVKAIQEQQQMIETLQAKVAALEAK